MEDPLEEDLTWVCLEYQIIKVVSIHSRLEEECKAQGQGAGEEEDPDSGEGVLNLVKVSTVNPLYNDHVCSRLSLTLK